MTSLQSLEGGQRGSAELVGHGLGLAQNVVIRHYLELCAFSVHEPCTQYLT